jgi:hypothetical protein
VLIATVGTGSGIVTGITGGFAYITYTISPSCRTTARVSVSSISGITGSNNVCQGGSVNLTSVGTGTWSSSVTGSATVNSVTGAVFGVAAGTTTITYTIATSCYTTYNMTVNPISVIGGSGNVCMTQTTTLTSSISGGYWTSGNPTIAAIGSTTGEVLGRASGTANITFTISSTGCRTVFPSFVVNRMSAITGASSVCEGQVVNLYNPVAGGTWVSDDAGIATVSTGIGNVTGVSAGVTVISYVLPTGCISSATVTVNPLTATTGSTSLCRGATGTLTNTTGSGTWSSSNALVCRVGLTTGIVTGLRVGTVNITYTVAATGCRAVRPISVLSCRQADENTVADISNLQSVLAIYPNPNKGAFTLKGTLGTDDNETLSLVVTNMLGEVVYTNNITVTDGAVEVSVQLPGNLSAGMYLLNISTANYRNVLHFVVAQ